MNRTDHLSELESLRSQVAELTQELAERDRSMQDLRESERRLRTVLDALPVGVWFTDQSGKPILVNPVAKQMWSDVKQVKIETGDHAAGWREVTGLSGELHRWALRHARTTGVATLSETFNLECLDGTKRTIRHSTVPVRDESGEVLGAIVLDEDIALLRRAQKTLQLTQFSVDHAVEGFFWVGPDGRIFNVNDTACKMLEYDREELTTMTVRDIDPHFTPEAWPTHWEELKRKGSMTFESKQRSRTGRILDTEVTVNYLREGDGKEYHCVIMRDIGERKRGAEKLAQLVERLELATSAAQIGVWDWNIQKNELTWDDRMFALYGVKREDFGGAYDAWLSGVHPDDQARCDEAIRQAIGKEKSYDIDFRIRWPNGRVHIVKADGQVIWDTDGTPLRMIGVNYDITERKQTEMKLEESNHRLRIATESARIGVWDYEIRENRLVWDEQMLTLYDYKPENFPGAYEAWSQRLHPDDKAEAEQALQAAIAGQRDFDTEFRLILPSGAVRYIKAYAQVLKNDGAVPTRMIGVNYDITGRKQAEAEIRRLNAELEQRIQDRTRQLEAANKELEAFSYSVSHDLRAPLRSIDGFSQALLEDCVDRLNEQEKGYLNRIRAAIQRLGQLIDDLLSLSRATRSELRREPVDLSAMALGRVDEIRRSWPDHQVELMVMSGLHASGDRRLLLIVLDNLLGNAWKFTSKQERATIEVGAMQQNGATVYFVRDNGTGFDMAYVGKLFGAFQRLHTMTEYPGTGIGLATVQRIVHRHGGRVWAEGAVGRGATFYFTLGEQA